MSATDDTSYRSNLNSLLIACMFVLLCYVSQRLDEWRGMVVICDTSFVSITFCCTFVIDKISYPKLLHVCRKPLNHYYGRERIEKNICWLVWHHGGDITTGRRYDSLNGINEMHDESSINNGSGPVRGVRYHSRAFIPSHRKWTYRFCRKDTGSQMRACFYIRPVLLINLVDKEARQSVALLPVFSLE